MDAHTQSKLQEVLNDPDLTKALATHFKPPQRNSREKIKDKLKLELYEIAKKHEYKHLSIKSFRKAASDAWREAHPVGSSTKKLGRYQSFIKEYRLSNPSKSLKDAAKEWQTFKKTIATTTTHQNTEEVVDDDMADPVDAADAVDAHDDWGYEPVPRPPKVILQASRRTTTQSIDMNADVDVDEPVESDRYSNSNSDSENQEDEDAAITDSDVDDEVIDAEVPPENLQTSNGRKRKHPQWLNGYV